MNSDILYATIFSGLISGCGVTVAGGIFGWVKFRALAITKKDCDIQIEKAKRGLETAQLEIDKDLKDIERKVALEVKNNHDETKKYIKDNQGQLFKYMDLRFNELQIKMTQMDELRESVRNDTELQLRIISQFMGRVDAYIELHKPKGD